MICHCWDWCCPSVVVVFVVRRSMIVDVTLCFCVRSDLLWCWSDLMCCSSDLLWCWSDLLWCWSDLLWCWSDLLWCWSDLLWCWSDLLWCWSDLLWHWSGALHVKLEHMLTVCYSLYKINNYFIGCGNTKHYMLAFVCRQNLAYVCVDLQRIYLPTSEHKYMCYWIARFIFKWLFIYFYI